MNRKFAFHITIDEQIRIFIFLTAVPYKLLPNNG